MGDLPAGLQTFYLPDAQTLQQVGINQLSAEVLQQQQQILQRQIELQVAVRVHGVGREGVGREGGGRGDFLGGSLFVVCGPVLTGMQGSYRVLEPWKTP